VNKLDQRSLVGERRCNLVAPAGLENKAGLGAVDANLLDVGIGEVLGETDVFEAIRSVEERYKIDPKRIALVGGSAGGYLSNMVGILNAPGIKGPKDPVDRTSARVQAVVTLFGPSDFRGQEPSEGLKKLLAPLIEQKGLEGALSEASPVTHFRAVPPPFLLIHGDKDEAVPLAQSTHLQSALKANGVRCDLIIIPNGPHATGRWHRVPGVPDWEKQMTEWLNLALDHRGPVGEGIRKRL